MSALTAGGHNFGAGGFTTAHPTLVGREGELSALLDALARPSVVVLIEGEAGIGKSRLLRECWASPAGTRRRRLVATCPPYRRPHTFGAIVDAIRATVGSVLGMDLNPLAGALRPLFPEWSDQLPPEPPFLDDPAAFRHRLFRALADLLDEMRIDVLVLEDAHWADEATLEFLLSLVAQTGSDRSVVVTYRRDDLSEDSPLHQLASRFFTHDSGLRLVLEPLDIEQTRDLVSSMLEGSPVSDEFAGLVHRSSSGVPFIAEELVRLMNDKGDLISREGSWLRKELHDLEVPPTVRDAVLERVRHASEPAQRVIEAASVMSEGVDEATLLEVAGVEPDLGPQALTEALRTRLVVEDDRAQLAMCHLLATRAVYDAIPAPVRRALHLRAGELLERHDPQPVDRLLRHFRESGEVARWVGYAQKTADRCVAAGDHTTAVVTLIAALEAPNLAASTSATITLALANAAVGRSRVDDLHSDVIRILRAALGSGRLDPDAAAHIRQRLARLLGQAGTWDAARAELKTAVSDLRHDALEAARAMIYLALPFAGNESVAEYHQWLERAGALIETSPASERDRYLPLVHAVGYVIIGDASGWTLIDERAVPPLSAHDEHHLAIANANIGGAAIAWGYFHEAEARLSAAIEVAGRMGVQSLHENALAAKTELDWLTGDWRGLADHVDSARHAPDALLERNPAHALVAAQLTAARGHADAAEHVLRQAIDRAQSGNLLFDARDAAAVLARLLLTRSRLDDALAVTDEPTRVLAAQGLWIWATYLVPVRVRALIAAERGTEAHDLVAAFESGLQAPEAPAPAASLLSCHAALSEERGDLVDAAAAYERSAAAWHALPRPYDALQDQERQAACLIGCGRSTAATDLLMQVFSGLTDLGARADADRVARELRRLGVTVPRPWRGGRKGYGSQLSPRELEVARLVAAGHTNREIAEMLSRSVSTIHTQLSSAMRKLGVTSRTALAVGLGDLNQS